MTCRAKNKMYGGPKRHKVRCAIRCDHKRPNLHLDATRIGSHMPSQAERHLFLAEVTAQRLFHAVVGRTWLLHAGANDPRYRVAMRQTPPTDSTYEAPGRICVIGRAIQGAPDVNQRWDSWGDRWLTPWGWNKVFAGPSIFWIATDTGIALMEVDNDELLVVAPRRHLGSSVPPSSGRMEK